MKPAPALGTALLWWLRVLAVAAALCLPGSAMLAQTEQEIAQGVISRLEHVGVDYPYVVRGGEVFDTEEYQGLHAYASEALALLPQLPAHPGQPALVEQARGIVAGIDARADGADVARSARGLAADLMRTYRLTAAPRQPPNLRRAQALFRQECAVCHGDGGRGDGPAARSLQPPPGDFLDAARMAPRSILDLYDAITTGVSGQPGHGAHLPFADRWGLAFWVSGLRDPPAAVERGEILWREGTGQLQLPDLRALVLQSPAGIAQEGGDALDAVRAFLTRHPEALDFSRPAGLVLARTRLREAVSAYARGETASARELALAADAQGVAPLDRQLELADPALHGEIVGELLALRSAIDAHLHAGTVAAHATRLEKLLDRAADLLARGARAARAVYLSALLILLREGVEAILVLSAMAAVVRQTGRLVAMRYIHAGWGAAVLLGLATWVAAGELLTLVDANRELSVGISTLLAAAMLLYVGSWLHQRSHIEAWQAYLRVRLTSALQRRTLWAMAGLSFLALYRELFEVVVMYRVLWEQAGAGGHRSVLAGMGTAAVLLCGVAWAIVKYSARLPLARFHSVTSALLVLMALVFVGHGIAALQEAKVVPATAVHFFALPSLGIHPTAQGLAVQGIVALLIAASIALDRWRRR